MAAINGVDDLLAAVGPERVLDLLDTANQPSDKKSQAQLLVELAAGAELFHTPDSEAYARVAVDSHWENWPVKGKGFRRWLRRTFHLKYGKPPGTQALQEALDMLDAMAQYDGPEIGVFTRIAAHADGIYIDLADVSWRAVEITASGVRVIADPPVRFRRPKGMQALPDPVADGNLGLLQKYLNLGSCKDRPEAWILVLSWLASAFRPIGPYPILVLQGPQGSAKSTAARVLRRLIDPFSALLRTQPRDEHDLQIAAGNSWVMAFDNLSAIPNWLSDAMCRLATGGGFSTRELYSDTEETIFAATRPIILNGIDQLCERPDLAERAVVINLLPIDDTHRQDEETFWSEFEQDLPAIFGALLFAVAAALRRLPSVKLSTMPRMADFARWGTAVEDAFGFASGTFIAAFASNRQEGVDATFESDIFAASLREFIENHHCDMPWEGTAKELGQKMDSRGNESTKKSREWPKSPKAVSNRLRRLQTTLRQVGITVEFAGKKTGGRRQIVISRMAVDSTATTASTATPDFQAGHEQGSDDVEWSGGQANGAGQARNLNGQPPLAAEANLYSDLGRGVDSGDGGGSGDVQPHLSDASDIEGWI